MANEKVGVKVTVDTSDASKNVDKLNDSVKKTGDSAKGAEKNAKQAAGAFGTIGNALKSLGIITLISKGFEFFQQVLGKNQKVADALSTSVNFLTGVFSDLIGFIVDNTDKVVNFFKDVFENPKKYIDQLADAIKNNLIERVNSVIEAFGYLGDVIKNVFTGNFDAAGEAAKKFGKEMVDVATGVDDAFDKTTKFINETVDAAGNYFSKKLDQAKALTKATNNAALAEASLLNAVKATEIEAEKLRQKRDDENISLQERIQANEDLAKVLQKGQQQELSLIGVREQKVRAEIALNGQNKDLQAELIRLQGERRDVEEKYTAFASEQLVNRNALLKEQRDIQKSIAENENKLVLDAKKANAELIKDEVARLEAKKAILQEEADLELKRLQDNINNTKAGTTARAEAEIAYAQKKAETDNQLAASEDQLSVARLNRELERTARLRTDRGVEYEERLASLDQEQAALDAAFANKLITEKDYNDKVKALTDQRIAYQEAELASKLQFASAVGSVFGQLAGLFEQGTAASKAAALAEIAINTGVGFVQGLDIAQKSAKATGPGAAFAFPIFYATQVAAVLAAASRAKQILATAKGDGKGKSGPSPASLNTSAPLVPAAPQASVTQLDQQSINELGSATSRAYVLEADVTSGQERIKRINRAARLS
jgi:hypothetical protein